MKIHVKRDGPHSVVYVSGEVDMSSSPELRATILELFRQRKQERVIVDLSSVPHIDSSCVASLMEGQQEAKKHNARLILVGLRQEVRHVIELTNLLGVFEIHPTEHDVKS